MENKEGEVTSTKSDATAEELNREKKERAASRSEIAAELLSKTVFVEGLRMSVEKLALKVKPLFSEVYGDKAVTSLVRRRDGYEITFESIEAANECVDNGLLIENRQYDAVSCANQELVVTLYPVPSYVDDEAIKAKLLELHCEFVGDVKRSQVYGVETGRRKVLVRLPPNTRSLPRAIVVKSVNGKDERIELYHRNQRLRKPTR